MPDWLAVHLTRQHIGIVFALAGTAFLAFSVRTRRQYQGEIAKVVDRLKQEHPGLMELTETTISARLFWAGLAAVAAGTLLQW